MKPTAGTQPFQGLISRSSHGWWWGSEDWLPSSLMWLAAGLSPGHVGLSPGCLSVLTM